MPKNYGPEEVNQALGANVATKNEDPVEVGRGTKGPSLHGNHTLEDKRKFSKNEANYVDLDENMALDVRKANVLDYIEGGGDGEGDEIASRTEDFLSQNANFIVHTEVDQLYPSASED